MAFSVLLLLLTSCTGFISEATPLTQASDYLSVAVGQTTSISCTLRGVEFISSNHPSWYRQRPGNPPQLLIYESNRRYSGIPDRFSGETFDNRAILTIARAQVDDEGDYYCVVHSNGYVFGGGTQLIVTDANQPSLPPNVNLFPPSVEEKESKNKATLVCLMDGFRPPDITVTWLADGTAISTGVETTKATKLNDNYVASSYLTLNPSEWESHTSYSCKVTHKGIDYTKSVGHSGSQCS